MLRPRAQRRTSQSGSRRTWTKVGKQISKSVESLHCISSGPTLVGRKIGDTVPGLPLGKDEPPVRPSYHFLPIRTHAPHEQSEGFLRMASMGPGTLIPY